MLGFGAFSEAPFSAESDGLSPTTGVATGVGSAAAGGSALGLVQTTGGASGVGSASGAAGGVIQGTGSASGAGSAAAVAAAVGVIQAFGAAFGVGTTFGGTNFSATGTIQAAGVATGVGSASGGGSRKFVETVSELPTMAGALYPAIAVVLTQNILGTTTGTYAWRPEGLVEEIFQHDELVLPAAKYAQMVAEIPQILATLSGAYPKSIAETMTYTEALTVLRGWVVAEALELFPAATPQMSYRPTLADILTESPELLRFVGGGIAETTTYTATATPIPITPRVVAESLTITDALTPRLVLRLTTAETIELEHLDALKMFFRPTLADTIDINAMHVAPDGTVTTWVVNTRTGGTTEYTNFNFNSFAQIGTKVLAASADGLFELNGGDDDGTPILSKMRSGYAQFGNSQFSSLRGAYIGVRATGVFVFKIITGDGKTYTYQVNGNRMTSTKVNMGKGIRARYIAYELQNLDGQDFDLDSVEFLPVIAQRRV